MRNIRVAERSAWVTSIPADRAPAGAPAPAPKNGPRRRFRVIKALVFAVALVGVPVILMDGTGTVNAGGSCLRIKDGQFNAAGADVDNLNGEWVRVRNTCGYSVSLKGWTLRDVRGHTYRFPAVKLDAGGVVKVHTGKGIAEAGHLYWKRIRPVWNNKAYERAYLIDPTGLRVSTWPKAERSFVLGVNINGPAVEVDGKSFRGYETAADKGFSDGSPDLSENGVEPRPAPDAAIAKLLADAASKPDTWRLTQSLPDGTYQLFLYTIEDEADYSHTFDVLIEGEVVGTDIGQLAVGEWRRWGPFESKVTDGEMTIDLQEGTDAAHLTALEIWRIKKPGTPKEPKVAAPTTPTETPAPMPTAAPTVMPEATPAPTVVPAVRAGGDTRADGLPTPTPAPTVVPARDTRADGRAGGDTRADCRVGPDTRADGRAGADTRADHGLHPIRRRLHGGRDPQRS